jgi:hypothetical protein
MSDSEALEMLADAAGCVALGALDHGVFYARLSRCLTRGVGEALAVRLSAALEQATGAVVFIDARSLESYDLAARAAFLRVVRERRSAIAELDLVPWRGAVSPNFLAALGQPTQVFVEPQEFEARMFGIAPRARSLFALRPQLVRRSRWLEPR